MIERFLVTGGCGFIGYHFIDLLQKLNKEILVIDKCTYAANPDAIRSLTEQKALIVGDICNQKLINNIFESFSPNIVVNFAAESHVDKSIISPEDFINTNIVGTHNLLQNALMLYERTRPTKFLYIQISTDEVYGALKNDGYFTEDSIIDPTSPYSASKAAADHLVQAYYKTHKLPVMITRCSNNYGPRQFPEKLIPLAINRALNNQRIPIYGTGENIRDWIHVEDHCAGIMAAIEKGRVGEIYNFGGNAENRNVDVVRTILRILDLPDSLIEFTEDRKGHDYRYAIDATKATRELNWKPIKIFEAGLEETVTWYRKHVDWLGAQGKSISSNIAKTISI